MMWRQIKLAAQLRKQYVPAYVKCLQQDKIGGDDAIAKMDAQLEEHAILWFRWPLLRRSRLSACAASHASC